MTLSARLLLTVLIAGIGSLAPVLPDQSPLPSHQNVHCCADMNRVSSHNCPINRGTNNSGCGPVCTAPAACLSLYFGNTSLFVANSHLIGTISVSNASLISRARRPPVPPPRLLFS